MHSQSCAIKHVAPDSRRKYSRLRSIVLVHYSSLWLVQGSTRVGAHRVDQRVQATEVTAVIPIHHKLTTALQQNSCFKK